MDSAQASRNAAITEQAPWPGSFQYRCISMLIACVVGRSQPGPEPRAGSAEKNLYRLCLAHRRGAKRSMAIVDEAVLHSGSMATIARTATRWTEQENIES